MDRVGAGPLFAASWNGYLYSLAVDPSGPELRNLGSTDGESAILDLQAVEPTVALALTRNQSLFRWDTREPQPVPGGEGGLRPRSPPPPLFKQAFEQICLQRAHF